ncbi:MAG: MarR family winged helix-turn-helix transcriptional regulator [Hyphomicrobiaceae bacterium]|nr:MarR family winged helix-turn-helix transcriptional regulator [Hyphomicrobiaceae bacterium]
MSTSPTRAAHAPHSRETPSLMHLLHRAGQCADEHFTAHLDGIELTPRQFEVLKTVALNKDPSQTTLVDQTGIDRSTLADIVRRLTDRGLLARRRTRQDARMYAIQLTAEGERALKKARPIVDATNARLLEALPKREREVLIAALQSLIASFRTADAGETHAKSKG